MIKKVVALALTLSLSIGLVACGCVESISDTVKDRVVESYVADLDPEEQEQVREQVKGTSANTENSEASAETTNSYSYNNNSITDIIGDEDIADHVETSSEEIEDEDDTGLILSYKEALGVVQWSLINRKNNFTVTAEPINGSADDLLNTIYIGVVAHTGTPDAGDYLITQIENINLDETKYYLGDELQYEDFEFNVEYCTTSEQEQAVKSKVNSVLTDLKVDYMDTDYEKVEAIYSWITENVAYDTEHVDDEDYLLKYSAYAALYDGKAVCQGCSALLYRMLLSAGVDCRCIYGETEAGPHVWNIVDIDGTYYDVDVTWDLGKQLWEYDYFLRGSLDFNATHTINETYNTEEFINAYPISEYNYDYNV